MQKIGILAYGSLIEEPGSEIEPLIVDRINTKTPFNVEFLRQSDGRGNAPTLIPSPYGGIPVNAVILILSPEVTFEYARNILYRRERNRVGSLDIYIEPPAHYNNAIRLPSIEGFENIDEVLYTDLRKNIPDPVTPHKLAELALHSVKHPKGQNGRDGISYLMSIKKFGVKTILSADYERAILELTETCTLENALQRAKQPEFNLP